MISTHTEAVTAAKRLEEELARMGPQLRNVLLGIAIDAQLVELQQLALRLSLDPGRR